MSAKLLTAVNVLKSGAVTATEEINHHQLTVLGCAVNLLVKTVVAYFHMHSETLAFIWSHV